VFVFPGPRAPPLPPFKVAKLFVFHTGDFRQMLPCNSDFQPYLSIIVINLLKDMLRKKSCSKDSDGHGMPLATVCAALRTAYFKASVGNNCFFC
jgi:hypothetical protein